MSEFTHTVESVASKLVKDTHDMYELEAADRYSFIRYVMQSEELWHLPGLVQKGGIESRYIADRLALGERGTLPSALPNIFVADDQRFMRLDQCEIIEINTDTHPYPYLKANLSECSVLVVRDEHRIWAAHIGFSQWSQMQHALEDLEDHGFRTNDMQVIASMGVSQDTPGSLPRLTCIEDYLKLGIAESNITTFKYFPPTSEDATLHHGLCEVIIGVDGVLATTFDADITMAHSSIRTNIHTQTEQETFVAS